METQLTEYIGLLIFMETHLTEYIGLLRYYQISILVHIVLLILYYGIIMVLWYYIVLWYYGIIWYHMVSYGIIWYYGIMILWYSYYYISFLPAGVSASREFIFRTCFWKNVHCIKPSGYPRVYTLYKTIRVSQVTPTTTTTAATVSQQLSQPGKAKRVSRTGIKYPVRGIPHSDITSLF